MTLAMAFVPPTRPPAAGLSPRERECLRLYEKEWCWKTVAVLLGISPRTARQHGDSARRKLGARTIGEAISIVNRRRM